MTVISGQVLKAGINRVIQSRDQAEGKDLSFVGMSRKLQIKEAEAFLADVGPVFEQ